MGKLFRTALFGGFHKKDVLTYLETAAEERSRGLSQQEALQQESAAKESALTEELRRAETVAEDLRQQLAQAQEHTAALRREADAAENRGAEARIRLRALEEELAAAQSAQALLPQVQEDLRVCTEARDELMQAQEILQAQFSALQYEAEGRLQRLEEQRNALSCQQAEYEKLQQDYTALLQRQTTPTVSASSAVREEELLYLRKEIERMRDSYDILLRQMLNCGLQREVAQPDPGSYRNLLEKMDRALECLEQLLACNTHPCQSAQTETATAAEPQRQEKRTVSLDDILRLVRKDR